MPKIRSTQITNVTGQTGTGDMVQATSPTLVTPALGTPASGVATNLTGLPLTTGVTGTLPVANGGTGATTLTANNVLLGNGTSAVQVVAPGTSGNVLTSNGTTWQSTAPSGGGASVKTLMTGNFENSTRYTRTDIGTVSLVWDNTGASILAQGTSSAISLTWGGGGGGSSLLFANSPKFTTTITVGNMGTYYSPTTGQVYFGIGNIALSGSGHTFTNRHIGFKIIHSGGVNTLYATQADGTTENVSSALTTVAASPWYSGGEQMEFVVVVNGTTSVDYYWRKNGGALSSVTTLTGNVPTGSTNADMFQWSAQSNGGDYGLAVRSFSYER